MDTAVALNSPDLAVQSPLRPHISLPEGSAAHRRKSKGGETSNQWFNAGGPKPDGHLYRPSSGAAAGKHTCFTRGKTNTIQRSPPRWRSPTRVAETPQWGLGKGVRIMSLLSLGQPLHRAGVAPAISMVWKRCSQCVLSVASRGKVDTCITPRCVSYPRGGFRHSAGCPSSACPHEPLPRLPRLSPTSANGCGPGGVRPRSSRGRGCVHGWGGVGSARLDIYLDVAGALHGT